MSPARVAEAVQVYEAGESLRQLSIKLGFNDKTIKKELIATGVLVQRPPRGT